MGFEGGLSAEQYFRLLEDQEPERPQPQRSGDGGKVGEAQQLAPCDAQQPGDDGQDGGEGASQAGDASAGEGDGQGRESESTPQPGMGSGGSCADGQLKPWELPAPGESDIPGIQPHEADMLIREVAEKIAEKSQGKGRGGMRGWANDVLSPRVDPKAKLLRAVRKAVEYASGAGDFSYRRPNRRNPRPDMVLPSSVQPIPRVTVIVDTSGSMDQRDLGLSLGLIGKVLNGFRIRDGLRVLCGDESVASVGKVFSPKQVELAGGGGTDMRPLIVEAAQAKPRPGVIVVCTDGYTDWPSEPVGVPVVACITRESRMKAVPAWMEAVCLQ
jgi:hypothetical protein